MSVWLQSSPAKVVLRSARKLWQATVGPDTAVERFLRWRYSAMILRTRGAPRYVLFSSGSKQNHQIGIFVRGGCDLPAVFACEPSIRRVLNGTCCIMKEGTIADSRSDFLLQAYRGLPQEWIEPVIKKLKLRDDHFQTHLFKKNMILPGRNGLGEFPKSVVILSIGSDLIRTLYRHREHGFLFDPGSLWLDQNLDGVLNNLPMADWLHKNFVSIGKISVDSFVENFTEIVRLVRTTTAAPILVFNNLTVEPGSLVHNFQFMKTQPAARRMIFNIALAELSRDLDFYIVDIDRVLKRAGVNTMVDFAHFPAELYPPVAQEAFEIMQDLRVFS